MTSLASIDRASDYDCSIALAMLPTDEGGRKGKTPGRDWHCRLKIRGRFFEVRLRSDSTHFEPGSKTGAKVTFLDWTFASRFVEVNMPIEVWELRRVAEGTVGHIRGAQA